MKLEKSREWWLSQTMIEGGEVISAGAGLTGAAEASSTALEEVRIALGRFVNLMRRQRGLSIERLAERAELDLSELLIIENDLQHVPEARTVYKLAMTFDVPQSRLMQLAGLAVANDDGFRADAVRFAARSESVQKLSPEESSALEAFIAVLSERGSSHDT